MSSMNNDQIDLTQFEGISKGEWILGNENNSFAEVCIGDTETTASLCRESSYTGEMTHSREEMLANAHAIAAVPQLIAELKALREENAELRQKSEDMRPKSGDYHKELELAEKEAEEWKAKGDMYGWNFHQGRASGIITGDILFGDLRSQVQQLTAEVERLKEACAKEFESVQELDNENQRLRSSLASVLFNEEVER